MERIAIRGLELFAYHGVNESERRDGQVFLLDLELEADLASACETDDLNDTVNYSKVMKRAAAAFTARPYNLIERAAQVTAQAVLDEFAQIHKLTLRVHKPDAPVKLVTADIILEIERIRGEGMGY